MVTKLIPHPILTLVVAMSWVLLVNDFSIGATLLGLVLGVAIPWITGAYWPDRPRIRSPRTMIEYLFIITWDIIVSNIQVAHLILFRRGDALRSRFVSVPLRLRTPEAIAVLAGTITLTPGTVTVDVCADRTALLVHCLETDDPEQTVATIKERYEARLMRIFE